MKNWRKVDKLLQDAENEGLIRGYSRSRNGDSFYFHRKGDSHVTRLSDHFGNVSGFNKIQWVVRNEPVAVHTIQKRIFKRP